jgi:hypothetical protein
MQHLNKLAEMRDEIKQLRQEVAELKSIKSAASKNFKIRSAARSDGSAFT